MESSIDFDIANYQAYVVFSDYGGYDGYGPPVAICSSESKAFEFIGRVGDTHGILRVRRLRFNQMKKPEEYVRD